MLFRKYYLPILLCIIFCISLLYGEDCADCRSEPTFKFHISKLNPQINENVAIDVEFTAPSDLTDATLSITIAVSEDGIYKITDDQVKVLILEG